MKKSAAYLRHSEQSKFVGKPVSEVGARSRRLVTNPARNDCNDLVLDLSGKPGNNSVAMVTGQKWTREQEAALDLSHGAQMVGPGQAMALDLSVPSYMYSQSHPSLHHHIESISQPQPPTQKSMSHHRPPGQYSLLQAALSSTQSNAVLQRVVGTPSQSSVAFQPTIDTPSYSKPNYGRSGPNISELQERSYRGMVMMDEAHSPVQPFQGSSTIRPFTSGALRPLGISVPQVAFSSSSGTVIPRVHKPIAITTPQVQSSHVTTTETVSRSTVSVSADNHLRGNTSAQSFPMWRPSSQDQSGSGILNQSGSRNRGQVMETGSDFLSGIPAGIVKTGEKVVERYVIRTPDGLNRLLGSSDFIQMEQQLGFACATCPKIFKTKAALKLHMTVHKSNEERQFVCDICHRRFLHRHHLVVHQRKHSGEKPFVCNACGKSFMAIFLLHKHLRKHVRENSLAAEISEQQLRDLNVKKAEAHSRSSVEHVPVIVSDDEESVVDVKAGVCEKGMNELLTEKQTVGAATDVLNEQVCLTNKPELSMSLVQVTDILPDHIRKSLESRQAAGSTPKIQTTTAGVSLIEKRLDIPVVLDSGVDSVKEVLNSHNPNKDESIEQTVDNEVKAKASEDCNIVKDVTEIEPWPEYSSADEVELDFATGALKVFRTNKEESNMKKECETDKIKLANTENKQLSDSFETEANKVLTEIVSTVCSNMLDDKSLDFDKTSKSEMKINEESANKDLDTIVDNDFKDSIVQPESKMDANVQLLSLESSNSDNKLVTKKSELNSEHQNKGKMEIMIDIECKAHSIAEIDETGESIERKDLIRYSEKNKAEDIELIADVKGNIYSSSSGSDTETSDEVENINSEVIETTESTNVQSHTARKRTSNVEDSENLTVPVENKKLKEMTKKANEDTFVCSECGKLFQTEEQFGVHMRYHKSQSRGRKWGKKKGRKLKCEICSKTVHTKHHLMLHMNVHKKNPALDSLKKAKANQIKANGLKTGVHCKVCKKVFKFQKSLNSHMRVHSVKLAERKLLSQAFRAIMEEAATSEQGVANERQLRSSVSDVESQLKNSVHEKSHKSLDDDSVIETDVVAESRIQHSQSMEAETTCNTSTSKHKLNTDEPPIHVIIGDDNVKRYLCHACDNTYTTKQKLRMHALIHKDNCYLCDVCGRSFFREVTLEKHVSTHMLPRPHVCIICKKSFIHKSSLMRHRAAHEKSPTPSGKQFTDLNFEMKMMDTYTMLQRENLARLQMKKLGLTEQDKSNVIDLSIPKKDSTLLSIPLACDTNLSTFANKEDSRMQPLIPVTPDVSMPPVLSPALTPESSNVPVSAVATIDLSPPNITMDTCHVTTSISKQASMKIEPYEKTGPGPGSPEISMSIKTIPHGSDGDTHIGRRKKCTIFSKRNTTLHTFHAKHRKTRVYRTSCRICKESFPNVMSLKTHMSVHNTVETHLYECHVCSHRFTQSCSLLRHCKTSCQDHILKCIPCKKTFQRRNAYEKHMISHTHSLPSLDGSFLDNRKDEVQVVDIKEEQLSAIDHYQHPSLQSVIKTEVKDELCDKSFDNEYDSSDSDARTMLYSEGEGYTNSLSDFSDNSEVENTPPPSPRKETESNVLSRSHECSELDTSQGSSGLNFLSAICTDLILAEKNEEMKRKQLKAQQELETVEILTNLGKLPVSNNQEKSAITTDPVQGRIFHPNISPCMKSESTCTIPVSRPVIEHYDFSKPFDLSKTHTRTFEGGQVAQNVKAEDNSDCQITGIERPEISNIPTVVYEIHAEAERRRRERLMRLINLHPKPDNGSATERSSRQFFQELSPLHQSPLSGLMKAQIPSGSLLSPIQHSVPTSHFGSASSFTPTSTVLSVPASRSPNSVKVFPLTHTVSSNSSNNVSTPTDLSVRQKPMQQKALDLSPRSSPTLEAIPRSPPSDIPPPALVPVFHCELCGMVLHYRSDLHAHLREHGVSPKSTPTHSPQLSPRGNIPYHHGNQAVVQSQTSTSMKRSRSEISGTPSIPIPTAHSGYYDDSHAPQRRYLPLTPLNLSGSPSERSTGSQSTNVSSSQPGSIDSPMLGGDLSGSFVSHAGSARNIDELRKDLRNKIYARRKSQGLEELTVEFKHPEPTEMSLEERQKLNYRRECNRQAAQRSRLRKKDLVDTLLEQLHKEEVVNSRLRRQMEFLSSEKKTLTQIFDSHKCVATKKS